MFGLMRSKQRSRETVVALLIACLLRALLPIEEVFSTAPSVFRGDANELAGFPCAGHTCGCHTAERCRDACCCFPSHRAAAREDIARAEREDLGRAKHGAFTPQLARATLPANRFERSGFFQSTKCAGGAPRSVAAGFTILSIEPPRATALPRDDGKRASALVALATLSGMRPSPAAPPPRIRDARA
jgi:hypothetical protein